MNVNEVVKLIETINYNQKTKGVNDYEKVYCIWK